MRVIRTQRAERIEVIPIPAIPSALPLTCYMAGIRPDEWAASVSRDEAEQERRLLADMAARIAREAAKHAGASQGTSAGASQ